MADERDIDPPRPIHNSSAELLAMGSASREEADAFLRKQSALADEQIALTRLQADDLRREDRLRHWSLRIRHISDVMKVAFEFSVAAILLVLAGLVAAAVWSAAHDHSVVIEAFSVPPDLAAKGLTGEVVASKMLARLSAMQAQTGSSRAASSYASNWDGDIKVQIPDTGISIAEANRFLHAWLGHQTQIVGEVYRTSAGIALTARAGGASTPVFTGREDDLDELADRVAASVYRSTQPYRYAIYLITADLGPDFLPTPENDREAREILEQLTHTGTFEDRVWAYDGLGADYRNHGDFYGARPFMQTSVELKPGLDNQTDLAGIEYLLQHDERYLKILSAAVSLAGRGGESDMDPDAAEANEISDRRHIALAMGDTQAVFALGLKLHNLLLASTYVIFPYYDDVQACAISHDAPCVLKFWQEDKMPLPYLLGADILLGHFREAAALLPAIRSPDRRLNPIGRVEGMRLFPALEAIIAANLGDTKEAHDLIDKTPIDCDICLRMRGRIAVLKHDWAGAAHWFAIVAARTPDIPFADTDWGETLLRKGDLDGAIAKFKIANQKGPHFADPLEMWGEALVRKNRSDLALAKFEEADEYAPNWGRLHLKWGEALLWTGDKAGAQKQFGIAMALDLTPAEKSELARVSAAHV